MASFLATLLLVALLPQTAQGRRTSQKQVAQSVTSVEPNGVGCQELHNADKDGLVEQVPASIQKILTKEGKEGLEKAYGNLVSDLRISRKGKLNNWKGSALYRTMVLHNHMSTFRQQRVNLFLTKQDSEGWFSWATDSIIKICLVDTEEQEKYMPTGVYVDSKAVDVGFSKPHECNFDNSLCLEFDGELESDMSEMPVNLMRVLEQTNLMTENMKMGAMINTAAKDSLWAAKIIDDFKPQFAKKGLYLHFCAFNSRKTAEIAARYTNTCPDGSSSITSEHECAEIARGAGYEFHGAESPSSRYPKGCYRYKSYQVYYNPHSTGGAEYRSSPICSKYRNYQDSLKTKDASFKYWVEYAFQEDYKPKLDGPDEPGTETDYPADRITAINQCMAGDSAAMATQIRDFFEQTASSGTAVSECSDVAGAEGRDSKAFPDCKCKEDDMQVHCGKSHVAERKFNINSIMSSSECQKNTAYCAKRPCMLPKYSTEM